MYWYKYRDFCPAFNLDVAWWVRELEDIWKEGVFTERFIAIVLQVSGPNKSLKQKKRQIIKLR